MMSRNRGRSDRRYSGLGDLEYEYYKYLRDGKVRIDVEKYFICPICKDCERKGYTLFELKKHASRFPSANFDKRARHIGLLRYLDPYEQMNGKSGLGECEYYNDLRDGKVRIDQVDKYFICPICQDYERKRSTLFELKEHASRIARVSESANFDERARHYGLLRYLDWYEQTKGESGLGDLEYEYYKDLRDGKVRIDCVKKYLICPFCQNERKEYELFDLGRHALRISESESERSKERAKHIGLRKYLDLYENKGRKFETAARDDALIHSAAGDDALIHCAEKAKKKEKIAAEDLDLKVAKITEIQTEGERKYTTLMCNLTNELENIMKQKNQMTEYYNEEMKMMQDRASAQLRKVYEAHKSSIEGLEVEREKLKLREKELKQSQALNESEERELKNQKNLVEENEMAITEQNKAYEKMLKLADLQKRKKALRYKNIIELEGKLDLKQELELHIQRMRGTVEVMKHMSCNEEEYLEFKKNLESIEEELKKNQEKLDGLENQNQALVVKERKSNDEVQEARKELMKAFNNSHGYICVKGMGELAAWPFSLAAKNNDCEGWYVKGVELCSLWQHYLRDPSWHPYKVEMLGGAHKEILDENDKKLKALRTVLGEEVEMVVKKALNEMNEYNPSGKFPVKELWNAKKKRKASLKEGIDSLIKHYEDKVPRRR